MMSSTQNPVAKETVAQQLRDLGVGGILVQMAARGQIVELRCEMPTCYCPAGAKHFDQRPRTTPFPDWAPNADHYPTLHMDGGHFDSWNVRLAHVKCNREDRIWRLRIRRMLEEAPHISFEVIAEVLNTKGVEPPPKTKKWSAKAVRRAYVS
jgi:hypothetical protein